MSRVLSDSGLPIKIALDSKYYLSILYTIAETEPKKIIILESYTTSFYAIFISIIALSASALLAGYLIKKFSIDIVYMLRRR